MWDENRNPVSQRPCQIELERSVGERPMATMQLGVLTARAVAFTRRLRVRGRPPCSIERGEVLEIYPRATLRRLAHDDKRFVGAGKGKLTADERQSALRALAERIDHLDPANSGLVSEQAFDALVSAYTGWLEPDGLEHPPADFNLAAGWIWFPRLLS